jgi:hypothetical protein
MFPRKNPAQLDECPYGCEGRDESNQRPLTEEEFARLSDCARETIENTPGQAFICGFCGGVHVRERHANVPLGILDGTAGPGWHSANFG